MKVNYVLPGELPLAGYYNHNIFSQLLAVDINSVVDDGEVTELRATEVLEYFPASASEQIMNYWIAKLAHGGKLILTIIDSVELARHFSQARLDIDQLNLFLYGEQQYPWQFRKTIFTLPQIVNYLESKGLKILTKRTSNFRGVVEGVRP